MTRDTTNQTQENDFRNLSSRSFSPEPAQWTPELVKDIENIKNKYAVPITVNLEERLSQLPVKSASFTQVKEQIPTIKEMHFFTDEIRKKAEELLTLLNSCGPVMQTKIGRNTQNSLQTINQLQQTHLPDLILGCTITKSQLPPIKGGRHRDPFKLALLYFLTELYVEMTGNEPKCWRDEVNNTYQGDCYDFLVDLNAAILPSQNLQFDKNSTIGQYLIEVLRERKTRLQESYTILLSSIFFTPNLSPTLLPYILTRIENSLLSLKVHFLVK